MGVRYLLDTTICIYIARHNPPDVRERFARHTASELAMSVITLGELRFGAGKSRVRESPLSNMQRLAQPITLAPLPKAAAEHYEEIRSELQKSGQIIGDNDLWITARFKRWTSDPAGWPRRARRD